MTDNFSITLAAQAIRKGELVAFPTETVYGLGASVFNEGAIQNIFKVKRRPQDNPLIVHISSLDQLPLIVERPPDSFFALAKAFFPGPLTILLRKNKQVPSLVSAGLPTIGVRMPAHPIARDLIEAVGVPLVAPSANLSGLPSSTKAEHVRDDFDSKTVKVLDGGPCLHGLESTVLSLEPTPRILRPGVVTAEQISTVLKQKVTLSSDSEERPASPGMKYRHYAPKAKVRLVHSIDCYNEEEGVKVLYRFAPSELYTLLRQADKEGAKEIVIVCDAILRQNSALFNRIERASQ